MKIVVGSYACMSEFHPGSVILYTCSLLTNLHALSIGGMYATHDGQIKYRIVVNG